jgi:hypothetical protein
VAIRPFAHARAGYADFRDQYSFIPFGMAAGQENDQTVAQG